MVGHIRLSLSLTTIQFRVHSPSELPAFASHGVSFTSLTIEPAVYLPKLLVRFKALGGLIHRATLDSIASSFEYLADPYAIVNCTGLGSLKLKDVGEDMYPVRGQVMILRAPWVTEGMTKQVKGVGGERTYLIPRRSGEVVVGGTREVNDWSVFPQLAFIQRLNRIYRHPDPRPETTLDLKRRALAMYPDLAPPATRLDGRSPEPADLDSIVLREVVGFRPTRRGGLKLERGQDLISPAGAGRKVPVIHSLGHSGSGWQCSWGCAEEVVRIVSSIREDHV